MSCDHELANEWARCSGKKASYITIVNNKWRRTQIIPLISRMCIQNAHEILKRSINSRPQSLRSFWPAAGIESSGSNHFEITEEITEFCPSGFTQSASMVHEWNGCSQSSRFLPQARRIVGSGDENEKHLEVCTINPSGNFSMFLSY